MCLQLVVERNVIFLLGNWIVQRVRCYSRLALTVLFGYWYDRWIKICAESSL